MAITRAQQARQMYKKGSKPVVQGGVENYLGRQPEVQAPRKWQSGPDKPPTELAYITEAEKKLLLKEDIHGSLKDGPNKGPAGIMSLDSFGDIGGAGAAGVDTDPGGGAMEGRGFSGRGGGESPADFKARQAKETAALNKVIADQEKDMPEKKSFFDNFKSFVPPTRKLLYGALPNDPKSELRYLANLKFNNPAAFAELPKNLRDLYEETEDPANEFMSYKDFPKFSFDDFEDLRTFQPTDGLNFAEYAAKYEGAPGLLYSGDVGGLIKIKNPDGTFRYERRPDDGDPPLLFPRSGIMAQAPKEKEENEDPVNLRLLAEGGRAGFQEGGDVVGGEFDFESARQAYGLGKLVKKITRSVKKIAKSPLGKVAIGAALFKFGSPLFKEGGAFNKFFFAGKAPSFAALTTKGALTGIAGLSALGGLTAVEDDEEQQYAGADFPNPIDFYLSGQAPMNTRLAAEGGLMRAGYQEGSKEPVAKKTMPLLDMGGMEKDYREEGGFVPIGRMEKADDVPARLSKNEFVFTADAVRNAGDGDVDLGAEKMYNMMKNLEAGGDVSEESQGLKGAREMFQTSQRLEEVL